MIMINFYRISPLEIRDRNQLFAPGLVPVPFWDRSDVTNVLGATDL
jgi:hypothetical protein